MTVFTSVLSTNTVRSPKSDQVSTRIADCLVLFFLAHCPPGTHGRKKKLKPSKHLQNVTIEHITLMPYCRTCPVGTYQSNYGQLSCRPCQKGFTTNSRKSANSNQCVSTARHICESNPGICNGGSCVAQHDFLYSCLCDGRHIGKSEYIYENL